MLLEVIYFDKMEYLSYNGEKYTDHPNAVNDHAEITLGNIENQIVAVGSWSPKHKSWIIWYQFKFMDNQNFISLLLIFVSLSLNYI